MRTIPEEIQKYILKFVGGRPQPMNLLEDIKSFHDDVFLIPELYGRYFSSLCEVFGTDPMMKAMLASNVMSLYVTEWFYKDLLFYCRVFRDKTILVHEFPLLKLFMRYPQIQTKTHAHRFMVGIFSQKTNVQQINLLWGLLTHPERVHFAVFVKESIDHKIEEMYT